MFFISFIGGSFFPDIDIILVALSNFLIPLDQSIFLFHKTITHSIITLSAIYLILLIVYEIKKDKVILNIANGFSWGVIIHIMLDLPGSSPECDIEVLKEIINCDDYSADQWKNIWKLYGNTMEY